MDKRVSYNGLWKLLIEKNIKSCLELSRLTGIAPSTLTRMRNNEYVAMDVLVRLCDYFNCTLNDIVEINRKENANENI